MAYVRVPVASSLPLFSPAINKSTSLRAFFFFFLSLFLSDPSADCGVLSAFFFVFCLCKTFVFSPLQLLIVIDVSSTPH